MTEPRSFEGKLLLLLARFAEVTRDIVSRSGTVEERKRYLEVLREVGRVVIEEMDHYPAVSAQARVMWEPLQRQADDALDKLGWG